MVFRLVLRIALSIAAFVTARGADAASFHPLGDLPGGAFESVAYAVSDHGSVVGQSSTAGGGEAFVWTPSSGIQSLGIGASDARGISADGTVIVGTRSVTATRSEAYRWSGGVLTPLPPPPFIGPDPDVTFLSSSAYGVSADGTTVVGDAVGSDYPNAGRYPIAWGPGGVIAPFGTEPDLGRFLGASADGSVLVGYLRNSFGDYQAIRYQDPTTDFMGSSFSSVAFATSATGSVVVGGTLVPQAGSGYAAFRSSPTGFDVFDVYEPPGGGFFVTVIAQAQGVSADGSRMVGFLNEFGAPRQAMWWTEETGMMSLDWFLGTQLNLPSAFDGWTDTVAHAISANGQAIVGEGINPSGQREAWLVIIPEPSPALGLGLGLALLARRPRVGASRRRRRDSNRVAAPAPARRVVGAESSCGGSPGPGSPGSDTPGRP